MEESGEAGSSAAGGRDTTKRRDMASGAQLPAQAGGKAQPESAWLMQGCFPTRGWAVMSVLHEEAPEAALGVLIRGWEEGSC